MARRPKFRKSSTLLPRILSGLFLIPLSLYLIYLGSPYSIVLLIIAVIGIFYEWINLGIKSEFFSFTKIIYIFLGSIYLGTASYWFFKQVENPEAWRLIYWLLFLVWSIDISAFAGGKLLKGPKLAPSISPNKTWSGFLCGMSLGVGMGYVSSFWLVPNVFTLWGIIALALIAQGGDLLESKAKRWANVKDSGSFIPGHGGFLDRLDSLLAVAFALALWQVLHY